MVVSKSLYPIRPNDGMVGDSVQEEVMDAVEGQEIEETEKGDDSKVEDRAEVDEVRRPNPAARPYTPTKAEVYEHEVTHLPYRTWCKHCVKGRGVSTPHRKEQGGEDRHYHQYRLVLHDRRDGRQSRSSRCADDVGRQPRVSLGVACREQGHH